MVNDTQMPKLATDIWKKKPEESIFPIDGRKTFNIKEMRTNIALMEWGYIFSELRYKNKSIFGFNSDHWLVIRACMIKFYEQFRRFIKVNQLCQLSMITIY